LGGVVEGEGMDEEKDGRHEVKRGCFQTLIYITNFVTSEKLPRSTLHTSIIAIGLLKIVLFGSSIQ